MLNLPIPTLYSVHARRGVAFCRVRGACTLEYGFTFARKYVVVIGGASGLRNKRILSVLDESAVLVYLTSGCLGTVRTAQSLMSRKIDSDELQCSFFSVLYVRVANVGVDYVS